MRHWPALDGLRGVAIVLVMGNHFGVAGFTNAGQVGVTLFFVLSGYLITGLLLADQFRVGRIRFVRFYIRRALRLLPALFVMLAVVVPLMAIIGANAIRAAVPAVFYYANWAQVTSGEIPVLGHLWTLSIEEQFYIVWPALLLALLTISPGTKWTIGFLSCGAGLAMVARIILWEPTAAGYYRVFYGTDTRADGLLLGCALAFLFSRATINPPRWLVGTSVAAVVAFTVTPGLGFLAVVGLGAVALASAVLVAAAATQAGGLLDWKPLVWTGTASYSLYLWHAPILSLVRQSPLGHSAPGLVVALILSLTAAILSRRLVEIPALRLRTRAVDSPSPAQSPGNPAAGSHRGSPGSAARRRFRRPPDPGL
jgi:peptidoglycan/LPS O-acetylase OafA/YrhL